MGLFSSIGKAINDFTGSSSAGAQSQKYNIQAMKLQNQFQKEFAQNAHQWEAEDLMKAGYNPALTTGLGGASAGGAGGGSGANVSAGGTDLIGMLGGIANIYNSTSATKAQNKLAETEAELKNAQTIKQIMDNKIFKKYGDKKALQDLLNAMAEGRNINAATFLTNMQTQHEATKQGLTQEQTNTERVRRGQLEAQTIKTIKDTDTVDMNNYILEKDVEMLKKYGISRTEIKEIGGALFKEAMGYLKAREYAKAAQLLKKGKK